MYTAYPETMASPKGLVTPPELSKVIDKTIERFTAEWRLPQVPAALQFPEDLEAAYEADTKKTRVLEIRFTLSASIGFMCATTVVDPALAPDLGWHGLELRLFASVIFASAVFTFGKVSSFAREMILCVAFYLVLNVVVGIPSLSRTSTAPYGMFISILGIIYANTTIPFRFRYAWPFNILCLATIATYIHFDPVVTRNVGGAVIFMGVVGSLFTLLANYRMERSQRLGYLLASKEALRLFALNRDRDELAAISSTDALTGIANRGHFDRCLATLFENPFHQKTQVHLIMLDVDFFKRYNDRYGHPAGDACLRMIAEILSHAVRGEKDLAFRYGGEEFGALLLATSQASAGKIAERIRSSVEGAAIEHANRDDGLNVVTVSVGVASAVVGDGTTAASLIVRADRLLYASKNRGRNRVSLAG